MRKREKERKRVRKREIVRTTSRSCPRVEETDKEGWDKEMKSVSQDDRSITSSDDDDCKDRWSILF